MSRVDPLIYPEDDTPNKRESPFRVALAAQWRTDPMFQVGVILVLALVLAALGASLIAPQDPLRGDLARSYLAQPGRHFLFGADGQGRDVLSRVLYGARISLLVGLISQIVAVALGLTLGVIAGY